MEKFKFSFLALFMCAVAFSFVSCGDEEEPEPVGSTDPADVLGTWKFSPSDFYYVAGGDRISEARVKESSDSALSYCSDGTITFNEDGTFVSTQLGSGTYELSDGEIALHGTFRGYPFNYARGEEWKKFLRMNYYGDVNNPEFEGMKETAEDDLYEMVSYSPQKIRFCVKGGKLYIVSYVLYSQDIGDDWRNNMREQKDEMPSFLANVMDKWDQYGKAGYMESHIEVHNIFVKQ